MMPLLKTVPTEVDGATESDHGNPQLMLPFEFSPVDDSETRDDRLSLHQWEDDGGAIGRSVTNDE